MINTFIYERRKIPLYYLYLKSQVSCLFFERNGVFATIIQLCYWRQIVSRCKTCRILLRDTWCSDLTQTSRLSYSSWMKRRLLDRKFCAILVFNRLKLKHRCPPLKSTVHFSHWTLQAAFICVSLNDT